MNSGLEQRICSSYNTNCNNCIGPSNLTNSGISYSKLETACISQPEYFVSFTPQNAGNITAISYAHEKKEYLTGKKGYDLKNKNENNYQNKIQINKEVKFNPDDFINPDAPLCQFVGKASEIRPFVEEAFLKTTGNYLPKNIVIKLISKKEMQSMPDFQKGTVGFCINRKGFGISEIVAVQGTLDKVMLTIGHEIGHSLSLPLKNSIEEEAKAFAFSIAWMNAIKENDIAGIAENIIPKPAENGLHNVALDFVSKLIQNRRNALDVFMDLISKKLRFENTLRFENENTG